VASQLMIQEENWTIGNALGNLACWRYFAARDSESWFNDEEKAPSAEEEDPEDIVRVRVKEGPPYYGMVPNNYMDDHFDLRDPEKILGKSLWYFNKSSEDSLSRSLTFLGLIMWGKVDIALQMKMDDIVEEIVQEVAKIVNNEKIAVIINDAKKVNIDVDKELLKRANDVLTQNELSLIGETKKQYEKWNEERDERFNVEYERHERKKNIESITQIKEELSREEERLFFFKNKEKLDYEMEEKVNNWKKTWPRRTWPGTKGYFSHPKWIKTPGKEMKTPRWVKREEKRGPPK